MQEQARKTNEAGKAGVVKSVLQSVDGVLFWGVLFFVASGDLT